MLHGRGAPLRRRVHGPFPAPPLEHLAILKPGPVVTLRVSSDSGWDEARDAVHSPEYTAANHPGPKCHPR